MSDEPFFLQVAHLCARIPQAQHSIVFRHSCTFLEWFCRLVEVGIVTPQAGCEFLSQLPRRLLLGRSFGRHFFYGESPEHR